MKTLPTFFFWHGSPMNVIEENSFTQTWRQIWTKLKNFKAILVVSAHYESYGVSITSREAQEIMYDFWGFPQELYNFKYPIIWSENFAQEIKISFEKYNISLDSNTKIDHGVWSILPHLFPKWVSVPVLQLSIDRNKSFQEHFDFAKDLSRLRDEWYLIFSSGNIVHNLWLLNWENEKFAFSWAKQFDEKIMNLIWENKVEELLSLDKNDKNFQLCVPSLEHFIPVIYAFWLLKENEKITFFNQKIIYWSLSMTSFGVIDF